jgi:two-component system, NtrC family, response regulator AtoC
MLTRSHPPGKGDATTEGQLPGQFLYGLALRVFERAVVDLAPTNIPILLDGESGVGKETLALEIHRLSRHYDKRFLKYNCAKMTPESLPGELGIEAGDRSDGSDEDGCTVFLDEIGNLGLSAQDRLLQILRDTEVLESGSIFRARLISSTTCDLEEEMRAGRFRRELYYRISGIYLRLPSLRERKEDIPALLDFFLHRYGLLFGRDVPSIDGVVLKSALEHSWPGNVRELENFARAIVVLGEPSMALSHLGVTRSVAKGDSGFNGAATSQNHGCSLKQTAREASRKAEREVILKALERTHWNRKRTALELQISYKALLYKLKQMNLDGSENHQSPQSEMD